MCFFIFHILSTPGWLYICVYIYIYYVYIHILLTSWSPAINDWSGASDMFKYVSSNVSRIKLDIQNIWFSNTFRQSNTGDDIWIPTHINGLGIFSWAQPCPSCSKWGDEGHFGPQFMTFHRALLLKHLGNLGKDGEACRESLWWPNGTMWWCPSWFAKLVYNILYSGGFLK